MTSHNDPVGYVTRDGGMFCLPCYNEQSVRNDRDHAIAAGEKLSDQACDKCGKRLDGKADQ